MIAPLYFHKWRVSRLNTDSDFTKARTVVAALSANISRKSECRAKAKETGTSDLHFKDFPITINPSILWLIPLELIEV